MREADEHLRRDALVLDYVGRGTERFTLPWLDESLFEIVGAMTMVLVLLPLIVLTLSVLTWLLLQL